MWRYKPSFGNLVNNTVQKLIADVIYKSKTIKETEWDRDYQKCFDSELDKLNKKEKPPVDKKDEFRQKRNDFLCT